MAVTHSSEACPEAVIATRIPHVLAGLFLVDVAFVVLNLLLFAARGRVPHLLFLDDENNLPTWWSSFQLLIAGLAFGVVAMRCRRVRAVQSVAGLAALLVATSIDETSSMHERIGVLFEGLVGSREHTIFHHTGPWFVIVGLPFGVVVMLLLRRLSAFLAEVPWTRVRLLSGFGLLLLGAVGVEGLTNFLIPPSSFAVKLASADYMRLVAIEEGLEMLGGSVLLWTAVVFFRSHWSTRQFADVLQPVTNRRGVDAQSG